MKEKKIIIFINTLLVFLFFSYAAISESDTAGLIKIDVLHDAEDNVLENALHMIEQEQRARIKTAITFESTEINMIKGSKFTLTPYLENLPDEITAGEYIWTSSDDSIVKVDTKGIVQAIGVGDAEIVCSSLLSNDFEISSTCKIHVYIPVSKITVKQTTLKIAQSTEMSMEISVSPENATNQNLKYESSDPQIATVTEGGIIKGIATGNCVITISSQDGSNKSVSLKLSVVQSVQKVALITTNETLLTGKTLAIKGNIEPDNADNKKLLWTSSDEDIATVDQTGKITGKRAGKVTITATSMDGTNISDSLEVDILQPMKKISVKNPKLILAVNNIWRQAYSVEPEDTSNQKINWTSSNESIANVDENGTIMGIAKGKCQIIGKAEDGGGAKISVNVEVRDFDYVITEPGEIDVDFETEYSSSSMIGVTNRGIIQRLDERVTDFGKNGCVISENPKKIKPINAGTDTITVYHKVNGKVKSKEKYTVFVAQSAVE